MAKRGSTIQSAQPASIPGKCIVLRGQAPGDAGGPIGSSGPSSSTQRVFLLSPANAAGIRARTLLNGKSVSKLAQRLRGSGAPLHEVFSFMSTLYFRGKLTYARRFANPPADLPGILIITPSRGLMLPESSVTLAQLADIALVRASHRSPGFRDPLERDARLLSEQVGANTEVVLLGSIATLKYVEPLLAILGTRLVFPSDFVGRGNMSRGGLLLRCCQENRELKYAPVEKAILHGTRPQRLTKSRKN
jgi:hypothetical protein